MRLHRFHRQENLEGQKEIRISDEKLLHQMRDVFRLTQGDEVIFFDPPMSRAGCQGIDYLCKIKLLSKKEGVFEKISKSESFVPEKKVTLLMSVIKKENFELIVEKATEIGVTEIVPVVTERTLVKNLNKERLQRIMIEASEQCGRGDVPTLGETLELTTALEKFPNAIAFDISGIEFSSQLSTLSPQLLIGPEGGWSEKELALLKSKNISLYSLGATTLRAETAAIVACGKMLLS